MDNQELAARITELEKDIEDLRGLVQGRGDIIKQLIETSRYQQETIDSLLDQLVKCKI